MKNKEIRKTNVARLLDRDKVNYELVEYPVDENNLGASHIAEQLGEDIRQVFKTIVMHGDKTGNFVCVVPGNGEIDLKKAAIVSGNKKCATLPLKELLPTTGYVRGGCSPIGMRKLFPTFIDSSALDFETIYVSAGVRGIQVKLSPRDLEKETHAKFAILIDSAQTQEMETI